jgi:hypothetical protein
MPVIYCIRVFNTSSRWSVKVIQVGPLPGELKTLAPLSELCAAVWPRILVAGDFYQEFEANPEPIAFMSVAVDTAGRIYEDFSRLLFLHAHREISISSCSLLC